jgi:hypothetical protein
MNNIKIGILIYLLIMNIWVYMTTHIMRSIFYINNNINKEKYKYYINNYRNNNLNFYINAL